MTQPTTESTTAEKATLYIRGGLGNVVKVECRRVEITRRAYAQYSSAIEYRFVPKGARRERGAVETYRSSLLVLEGHGHPDPDGIWDESSRKDEGSGVSSVRARYSGHDPRWESDFGAMIDAHIQETGAKVVWDTRGEAIS